MQLPSDKLDPESAIIFVNEQLKEINVLPTEKLNFEVKYINYDKKYAQYF